MCISAEARSRADLQEAERAHSQAQIELARREQEMASLQQRIEDDFVRRMQPVELLLPYTEGGRLAELHELAGDLEREDTPDGVRVRARVPARSCTLRSPS